MQATIQIGQAADVERRTSGLESPERAAQNATRDAESLPLPRSDGRFRKGNKAGANRSLKLVRLDTPRKVRIVLWETIRDLRKGVLRADVANAVINGCRLLLAVYEIEEERTQLAEMDGEIERLRARLVERLGIEG